MPISRVMLALAVLAILAGAEAALRAQGQPPESKTVTLAPTEIHEACLELAAGQRLRYAFDSAQPLDFNIHYHEGDAVTYPVEHGQIATASDAFTAPIAQVSCLMWNNPNAAPATLNYSIQVP